MLVNLVFKCTSRRLDSHVLVNLVFLVVYTDKPKSHVLVNLVFKCTSRRLDSHVLVSQTSRIGHVLVYQLLDLRLVV